MADNSRERKRGRRKRREQGDRFVERHNSCQRKSKSPADDVSPQNATTNNHATKNHRKQKIQEKDITGLKYFEQLTPLLERLHKDGCERDRAKNRQLHYDQYCLLLLLYLFNPIVTSLRGIQQASELKKVQKKLDCKRASLGSLSEATSVFDAERLQEIIAELGGQLEPLAQDKRLQDIQQTITLVDGSLIAALPKIMEASWRKATDGNGMVKWRLHTHFELLRGVPTRIERSR